MADQRKSHISSGSRVGRAAPLVGLAGRTAGEAVVSSLRRRTGRAERSGRQERNAQRYADRLGQSKGVLMKAGQILSFTTFGPAVPGSSQSVYQRALARLQDSAPPMPYSDVVAVIEAELGGPPEQVFAEFDREPLGAASIGQVHAGRLHDGRRVAVKVQYPGVAKAIRADLDNAELLATFLQVLKGMAPNSIGFDVRSIAAEVSERIGEEIDYLVEAKNQAEFADHYRGHPFIRVPEVCSEYTTSRVLTMELVEGKRFSEAIEADIALRDRWGEAIFRFAIGSVRRLLLFHADPHPGNYLFHDDGSVTFLDFGCIKRLDAVRVGDMKASVSAAVDRDGDELAKVMRRMGFLSPSAEPDRQQLLDWYRRGMESLTEPQPYTCSASTAGEAVAVKFSPIGPYRDVLSTLSPDPQYTMMVRIDVGMNSVLGALRATAPWEAIRSEWDRGGPAATPMGERDMAFWGASL
ncbi:AarF/UbiB family protein [Antrihabitans stalactiti]|uniref:AarF/ABC1/UbiB kinase family protein n=1 Tax=Antrihabitans stalactiti TaxID=2584121 RepID=A0A848KGT5_9NOCA|nr:AarF/ABC1/UbiB kinase family protein [Antrihabitans stalactiti]